MKKSNQNILKNVIRESLIDCLVIAGGLWDKYADNESNVIEPVKLYNELLKRWGSGGRVYQKCDWTFDIDEAYDHFQQTGYDLLQEEYNIQLYEERDEKLIREYITEEFKNLMGE